MSARSSRRRAGSRAAALALVGSLLTGCSLTDGFGGPDPVTPTTTPAAADEQPEATQFTRDGTFQSHLDLPGAAGLDFVYTLYPTKATPRTNEWYPAGKKYFSFTFQAYDLDQKLRAPFASKRKVYLGNIRVTSSTTLASGDKGPDKPYRLDARAQQVTFDPEPVTSPEGMLITSPKGAFELRNQVVGPMEADTREVTLRFRAEVFVQAAPGGDTFVRGMVKQNVPVTIFPSSTPTSASSIPVDAG